MRFVIAALAVSMAAWPVLAQTTPAPLPTASAPTASAPTASAPAASVPAKAKTAKKTTQRRMTFAQRFEAANTTHDGHLTKEQAQAAHFRSTVAHFDAIDKDHKGYVTMSDLGAYAAAQRTAHRAATKKKPPA